MTSVSSMTVPEARRLFLDAQGFRRARPARVDARHIRRTLAHTRLLQMDSVNVLARAHYMPLFSRLGPYSRDALDALAYRRRELFEYWGHEASLIPMDMYPLFRWRMDAHHDRLWPIVSQRPDLIDKVYAEVVARGPVAAGDVSGATRGAGQWWGWNETKIALEWLFRLGRVASANRSGNFVRMYDVAERVIPAGILDAPRVEAPVAVRRLLVEAADALGVGTASDLADYFRIHKPTARAIVRDLVAEGELETVTVDGWRDPAFIRPGARAPRSVHAAALVSPFDPLVWERARTERLFGFTYRIEIYVPAPKRVHGYYVLPFFCGDRPVARVDLKADRKRSVLVVAAAFAEPGADPADALAGELRAMAAWLGMDAIEVVRRGDLAAALRSRV